MTDGLPDYAETDMRLNANLVTIIGGRGTGKSLLLDTVFLTFDQDEKWKDNRLDSISPEQFTVDYQKAESEITEYPFGDAHPLSYLHVRQGDIKKYVESPEKLSDEIKKLLRIELEGNVSPFDFELSNLLEKIAKRRAWFKQVDSNGDPLNSLEFNQNKVRENSALIETITTDSNRALIRQYSDNAKQINDKRQIISKIDQVLSLASASESELSIAIEQLNELVLAESRLPLVDYSPLRSASTVLKEQTQQAISSLEARNAEISDDFRKQGIDQDVSGLLAKVEQYQRAIDSGKAAIDAAQTQKEQLSGEVDLRNGYSQAIQAELVENKQEVDDRFSSLKAGSDDWTDSQKSLVAKLLGDIEVSGEIVFDEESFYDGLVLCLNGRKFRSTYSESQLDRVKQKFNVSGYDDYIQLIRGEPIIDGEDAEKLTLEQFAADSDYFVSAEYDIWDYLYVYRYRSTYLGVSALIQYKGKPPEKLSVGQRGTFYVSMKLATDPFGSPFIFDQPEDDLDNEFIMEELVPIFRDIKKYRQVIIATHNANLVVNADAEQVIVAKNDDEILSYESGSLEHTCNDPDKGIREHVCTILEGGKDAFENRERKYGFRAL
jgi:ABC-type branched-subunit amino acid transport system ATPase component